MTTIYEKHAKDFSNVSAYIILNDKHQKIGIITIKHPKNYDGKLTAYLHIFGSKMQSYSVYGGDSYTISQAFKNLAQKVLNDNKENGELKIKLANDDMVFCDEIVKNGFTFDTGYQTIAKYSVMRAI